MIVSPRGAMLRARLTRCRTLQDESLSSSPATRESTFHLNASYRGSSRKNLDQLIIPSENTASVATYR
ncbi:hypothetical protein V1478_003584 [Vespula squamosa]|uniref:Uncharacterized protein n=1 Tax=Vespula squamosa TaxID=30214 RepID=A0ABD2BM73_VESSQ